MPSRVFGGPPGSRWRWLGDLPSHRHRTGWSGENLMAVDDVTQHAQQQRLAPAKRRSKPWKPLMGWLLVFLVAGALAYAATWSAEAAVFISVYLAALVLIVEALRYFDGRRTR